MRSLIQRNQVNWYLFAFLAFASAVDAIATTTGLYLDLITEANPLMNIVINYNVFLFVLVKIAPFPFLGWVFYKKGFSPTISYSLAFASAVYLFILFLHVRWIFLATKTTLYLL